ncbi:MAG: ATP-binding protein [Chloroflexi bacterium]|nr:ATP-binding protein [Chloroflexota bacterium]
MEKFLMLCRTTSNNLNWKDAIETLITKVRQELIFDNLVIYQTDLESKCVEVLFAKSVGRGKSAETEGSWGETISYRVIQESKIIVEPSDFVNQDKNRLESPHLLGIPIKTSPELPGALILIRFGGPVFSNDDIVISEFLTSLITSIIRQKYLGEFQKNLDEEKALASLQADFINTISHELRSPLGFIKGYTTTLLRKDTTWDQNTQNDFLEIIERETNSLTDLIDNLLDSSRLQIGHLKFDFQMVRVDSLIRDEVNRAHLTDPKQDVILEFEPKIPAIEGDSHRLAQVFDNLLSNASKYAPGAHVVIKLGVKKDRLIIEFKDNGPGIPDQFVPLIFSRFFRVPNRSQKVRGSGLGLFICKQIIDSHDGTITISSSENGTIFMISLPLQLSKLIEKTE